MSLHTIDWVTTRDQLQALATTPVDSVIPADPFGAHAVIAALTDAGTAYDADVAAIREALAAGDQIKPAVAQAALLATPAATDWHASHLTSADRLTRIIVMGNKLIAAFPWSASNRPPGLRVGWPWLAP